MKILSKDGLVLGGIYFVISFPFLFMNNSLTDFISAILFFGFVYFAILLQFNKVPHFIKLFHAKFPKLSIYIEALGWIPYTEIIIGALLILFSLFFITDDYKLAWLLPYVNYLYIVFYTMIFVSLIYGFRKSRK